MSAPANKSKQQKTTDKKDALNEQAVVSVVLKTTGNRKYVTRKRVIQAASLLVVMLLLIGCVKFVQHMQDQKTAKKVEEASSLSTDCHKIMKEISTSKGNTGKTQAQILEVKVNCSMNLGQYDQALTYLKELKKVYESNPNVFTYINIDSYTQEIARRKADSANPTSQNIDKSVQPTGRQPDGSYGGP